MSFSSYKSESGYIPLEVDLKSETRESLERKLRSIPTEEGRQEFIHKLDTANGLSSSARLAVLLEEAPFSVSDWIKEKKVELARPRTSSTDLFKYVALRDARTEPLIYQELVEAKLLSNPIERDRSGRIKFNSSQQDLAYFLDALASAGVLADTWSDQIFSMEFCCRAKSENTHKPLGNNFRKLRERARSQDTGSQTIKRVVKRILDSVPPAHEVVRPQDVHKMSTKK